MDIVNRFGIPAEDINRALNFYSKVFGWKSTRISGMVLVENVSASAMHETNGAMGGVIMKREGLLSNPVIMICVSSIDKYMERIKEMGGEMLIKKFDVDGVGLLAYFQDTEGNTLGLWQDK